MHTVFVATFSETWKGLLLLWGYRMNFFVGMLSMAVTFIGISFLITNGEFDSGGISSMLLGYLVWFFVLLVTANMGEKLLEEAQTGTLEQMYITPVPAAFLLIGRTIATLVISALQIGIVAGIILAVMRISLPWRWDALPVIGLTLMGLFGFGFVLGGAALIFKQAVAIVNMANNVLIFLNGALVPIDIFPPWLQTIARTLPSTQGIVVLRRVLLDGATLGDVWNDGSLVLLLVHSLLFFVGGWLILNWCERIAREQGTLGQY